jgi:hypothetical protein
MFDAGIFVDFTKEILAVNELQRPAPERFEVQPKSLEFRLLAICHHLNDVTFIEATKRLKTLMDTCACSRAWHNKFHFAEISQSAVVQIGDILIREEVANHRVGAEELKGCKHTASLSNPIGQFIFHHAL